MKRALLVLCCVPLLAHAQSSSEEHGDEGEQEEESKPQLPPPRRHKRTPPRDAVVDGMLHVPAGRFVFGRRRGAGPKDERPTHEEAVRAFWMDRTEVTVGAFRACVNAGACTAPARTSAYCTFFAGDDALPINCVRFAAAEAFCAFRGARLPTEREWEYAAKGPREQRFPWGDLAPTCEVAATLRSDRTAKSCTGTLPARVASHPEGRGPFGHLDLAGNVEEWTADFYVEPLPAAPPRSGSSHVIRGGSWLLGPSYARTTARSAGSAMEAGPGVGFRCAKDG